ncbi:MAG: methylmalonyl Co-A mutase-associated GTPase MeaB, partial [Propionibacteriaceae bacterium]
AMVVCEAAGYDVIIVETVGVGQSEVAVAGMVDTFLLLALTRAGDQLQGIKRGILEIADIIAVNKADGDNLPQARMTARELSIAMRLMSSGEEGERIPPVLTCSAYTHDGLDDVWGAVLNHRGWIEEHEGLASRRGAQQADWMWAQVLSSVSDALTGTPELAVLKRSLAHDVTQGTTSALDAAATFLRHFGDEAPTLLR